MKTRFIGTAVLVTLLQAGAGSHPQAASVPRPDVKLRVSTHSGPLPLELTLSAELPGVTSEQFEACYINEEWTYKTPAGTILNSKKDLPCVEPGAEIRLPATFEKTLTLKEPGNYLYRIVLQPREGLRQAFTTQEVKVYKGPVEVGVTGTHNR